MMFTKTKLSYFHIKLQVVTLILQILFSFISLFISTPPSYKFAHSVFRLEM